MKKDKKKRSKLKKILSIVSGIISLFVIIFVIYVSDYYHADDDTIETFIADYNIEKKELEDGIISYEPSVFEYGFIFYPGGKVESDAYEPLMYELASLGVLCVLVEMPFNLAVFNVNAADDVFDYYPNVTGWYIGGHSLGGSMAATYLEKHSDKFEGLILLASYSTSDLSDKNISVLSIYGSEDKVLNMEKYIKYKNNMPKHFYEVIIKGGCHAYFGMYGAQEGDGNPIITVVEQIKLSTRYIAEFICCLEYPDF